MTEQKTVSIRRLSQGRASEVRIGRWLGSSDDKAQQIIDSVCSRTPKWAEGRHVLAIQDTTELNYEAHAQRVGGLGKVGNGKDAGLFLHPSLVIDAQNGSCLGLAHIHYWLRTQGASENYQQLPIEQKESYRWLEGAQRSKERLSGASLVTIIADRESDIYEQWYRTPDAHTHVLTRACRDRQIHDGQKLYAWMDTLPSRAQYSFEVAARSNKRTAHTATVAVQFSEVTIYKPKNSSDSNAPKNIQLYAINVRELDSSVVGKEEPIHWRLLTTHTILTYEGAIACVRWYQQRWHIEQLFRTLKKQGLDIESSQLESAIGLINLACMATYCALRIMQLTLARDGNSPDQLHQVFDDEEIEALKHLSSTREGNTLKQKNPHPPTSLAYASWVIARLGGWKGYASEAKPGPITMGHGYRYFLTFCEGWKSKHQPTHSRQSNTMCID